MPAPGFLSDVALWPWYLPHSEDRAITLDFVDDNGDPTDPGVVTVDAGAAWNVHATVTGSGTSRAVTWSTVQTVALADGGILGGKWRLRIDGVYKMGGPIRSSSPTVAPTAGEWTVALPAETGTLTVTIVGGGGAADPVAVLRSASWALSATATERPVDITGGRLNAAWGTGEYDISDTRFTPADGPRLLHWFTEDEDAPAFLGASTTPIDCTALDGIDVRAKWRAITPWHTDIYPQSIGLAQGGNGSGDSQIISYALGISENGQIRFTGRDLGNNDFGEVGQFLPAAGVEVRVTCEFASGTITAYTKVGGTWAQVGSPVVKEDPIVLVGTTLHKFATGYSKGWYSRCEAYKLDGTLLRRFEAADAVANSVLAGDTWVGADDGQTWLLGVGVGHGSGLRIPVAYATPRACWALGAGDPATANLTVANGEAITPTDAGWSLAAVWTPRSGDNDETIASGPGWTIRRVGDNWRLDLATAQILPDGTLVSADSGAFGATTDGAGTQDPKMITTTPFGGPVIAHQITLTSLDDRDLSVLCDGGVNLYSGLSADFSTGVVASFVGDTVSISDHVDGSSSFTSGTFTPTSGQRLGIRRFGDVVAATVDGLVICRGTTAIAAGGPVGIVEVGDAVTGIEVRTCTTAGVDATADLGELDERTPHVVVSVVDPVTDTWRVRVDGAPVTDTPPPSDMGDPTGTEDLTLAPLRHQDLHDLALWLEPITEAEILAIEALAP